MPKPKWKLEKPMRVSLKLKPLIAKRYKALMISKGRTMQEDLENYITNLLN